MVGLGLVILSILSYGAPWWPNGGNVKGAGMYMENMRRGEEKIPGKKIQTLFLETLQNPPQLHHMTLHFKANATLLLGAGERPGVSFNPRAYHS